MLRIITGFVLAIPLVSSSFAFDIQHGKVIEHREWQTGKGLLQIKDKALNSRGKPSTLMLKSMQQNIGIGAKKAGVILQNRLSQTDAVNVGEDGFAEGNIYIYIENHNPSNSARYTIYSNFCLMDQCALSSYLIELEPDGYFSLNVKRTLSYELETEGYYPIGLYTVVDGADLNADFATFDQGYLEAVE